MAITPALYLKILKAALGVLVLIVIATFVGLRTYHTRLCNGYRMWRMNATEAVIATPTNAVVTRGTVTLFAVKSPYITGYTSSQRMSPDTNPVDGYFVIDTASGTVVDGLTERDWKLKLSELRWIEPTLRKPW